MRASQNSKNLKKMLRKSPALNALVATFKNTHFNLSSLKVTKLSKLWRFFLFKILLSSLLIVAAYYSINRKD